MAETDESTNEAEEEGREGLGGPHFVDEEFNGGTDYPLPLPLPPRGGIISLLFSSFRPSRGGGMGLFGRSLRRDKGTLACRRE